jgi:hypothetical protein
MHMRSFVLGASLSFLLLAGLLVGRATAPGGAAQAAPAPAKWDYNCMLRNSFGDGGMTRDAKDLGKEGWEMAMGMGLGLNSGYIICFKKPLVGP